MTITAYDPREIMRLIADGRHHATERPADVNWMRRTILAMADQLEAARDGIAALSAQVDQTNPQCPIGTALRAGDDEVAFDYHPTLASLHQALKEMIAARDAEAATADRTAQLYDCVLRWALDVEARATLAGVPLQSYLVRGAARDHALWLAVAAHRERYPASAGPGVVAEVSSSQSPSLRPWAPSGEVLLRLGSAAEPIIRLANLTDDRVDDGFLAPPVARVEALAYRDAARVGLAALRRDDRVHPRVRQILEDLAARRRAHDPALGVATRTLIDQLRIS